MKAGNQRMEVMATNSKNWKKKPDRANHLNIAKPIYLLPEIKTDIFPVIGIPEMDLLCCVV
jgi:hypothetical protein